MAKKVLIISTSLRGGSNSDILANECAKGAKEAGHDVELLSLKGKDIKYCIGCLSCQRTGMCVQKDDIADIMAKVKNAEVIVYATPIYYYEMCGQMKTLLDRLNPLYSADYLFRDIYMIATAAENDESAFEKAYNGLQGWVDCFEKASLKGMVGGGGIDAANTDVSHLMGLINQYHGQQEGRSFQTGSPEVVAQIARAQTLPALSEGAMRYLIDQQEPLTYVVIYKADFSAVGEGIIDP